MKRLSFDSGDFGPVLLAALRLLISERMAGVIVIGGRPLLLVVIDSPSFDLEASSGWLWEKSLPAESFLGSALHLNSHQNRAASSQNFPYIKRLPEVVAGVGFAEGHRSGLWLEVGQAFQPDSGRIGPGPGADGVRLESLTYFPGRPNSIPSWSSPREQTLTGDRESRPERGHRCRAGRSGGRVGDRVGASRADRAGPVLAVRRAPEGERTPDPGPSDGRRVPRPGGSGGTARGAGVPGPAGFWRGVRVGRPTGSESGSSGGPTTVVDITSVPSCEYDSCRYSFRPLWPVVPFCARDIPSVPFCDPLLRPVPFCDLPVSFCDLPGTRPGRHRDSWISAARARLKVRSRPNDAAARDALTPEHGPVILTFVEGIRRPDRRDRSRPFVRIIPFRAQLGGHFAVEFMLDVEVAGLTSWGSIMGLRWRVRSLLIGVAPSAIGMAAWVVVQRRSEYYTHLAAYHLQAQDRLRGGRRLPPCFQLGEGETLETWEEELVAGRGRREHLAYRASTYHRDLFEKYREAASRRGCSSRPTRRRLRWRTPGWTLMRAILKRSATGANPYSCPGDFK